jgi:hypothetical protein
MPSKNLEIKSAHDFDQRENAGYSCRPCPVDTYKPTVGQGPCDMCPEGFHAEERSEELLSCVPSVTAFTTTLATAIFRVAICGAARCGTQPENKAGLWWEKRTQPAFAAAGAAVGLVGDALRAMDQARKAVLASLAWLLDELFGSIEAFEKAWRYLTSCLEDGNSGCYGATVGTVGSSCCRTCGDVQRAFRAAGWEGWERTPLCAKPPLEQGKLGGGPVEGRDCAGA